MKMLEVKKMLDAIIQARQGATLTLSYGKAKHKDGYYVSLQGTELIRNGDITVDEIIYYRDRIVNNQPFKLKNIYIGLWYNEIQNTWHVDVSVHVKDKALAVMLGKSNEQIAIYDIQNKKSIYLVYKDMQEEQH